MRLADFIREHMESILVEWQAFASTQLPAASTMTGLELRNHAEHILEAIAKDLSNEQSDKAQHEKSQGRAPVLADAPETAAQTHAVLRGLSGFDINQLVAEYRALRASVLRLWSRATVDKTVDPEDERRFNEAIDQALAESVCLYSAEVERSRELLVAMVGHDLRSPLSAIHFIASALAQIDAGERVAKASQRLLTSSRRMSSLLDDLADHNRARLGLGLKVSRAPMDLAVSFAKELDLLQVANPDNPIDLVVEGDVSGSWDERRLQQVIANLILNAVKYGLKGGPIRVRLTGGADGVNFEVLNAGRFDPRVGVERLFDPLRRGLGPDNEHGSEGLGLGLYIAREIVVAHGGRIDVHTHPSSTVFSVSLPREL